MRKAELEKAVGAENVPVDAAVEGIRANVQKLKSMHALTAEHVTRIVAVKKAIEDLERHIDMLEDQGREKQTKQPSPPSALPAVGKTPLSIFHDKKFHKIPVAKEKNWPSDLLEFTIYKKQDDADARRRKALEEKMRRLKKLRHPPKPRA